MPVKPSSTSQIQVYDPETLGWSFLTLMQIERKKGGEEKIETERE